MTHTPWENDHGLVTRFNKDGFRSFDIFDVKEWQGSWDEGLEIANLMVTAVNSHDGLLEALEKIRELTNRKQLPLTSEINELAEAAIKAATKEPSG